MMLSMALSVILPGCGSSKSMVSARQEADLMYYQKDYLNAFDKYSQIIESYVSKKEPVPSELYALAGKCLYSADSQTEAIKYFKLAEDAGYEDEQILMLQIKHYIINIKDAVDGLTAAIPFELSEQSRVNLQPRIRMSTLYAVSQSNNGRVANTCNLSEDWVGYSTRYGDSVGDFSPCSGITVAEMKQIGRLLGLPDALIDKAPSDGLCGKTDEDNLGFTYAELDRYIREGVIENQEHKALIDRKHELNLFKLEVMPSFKPEI